MTFVDIEEVSKEKNSLVRSCRIKINGGTIITPSRAVSVTKSKIEELKVSSTLINNQFRPFGEVFVRVPLDFLSKIIDDDYEGQKFSSMLATRLGQLKDAGLVPYLILSLVDNEDNPYNKMPPPQILDLLFNFIWGTPNNSIIVPPLIGVLNEDKEYIKYIAALEKRQKDRIDKKPLPMMAIIPPVYRLIAPELLERYWKIGCRVIAFDLGNKKYSAFGYVIEKLHSELNVLSKRDKEPFILHALNSKLKTGRGDTSRINDLLGTGFGFDSYAPNHGGRPKWIPPPAPPTESNHLFDRKTYGFFSLSDVISNKTIDQKDVLNTYAFKNVELASIVDQKPETIKRICSAYNLEKTIGEIRTFPELINNEELIKYFSKKERIQDDLKLMKNIADRGIISKQQKNLDKWFI